MAYDWSVRAPYYKVPETFMMSQRLTPQPEGSGIYLAKDFEL